MDTSSSTLMCPFCKKSILFDQALSAEVSEKFEKEFEVKRQKEREEDRKKMLVWKEEIEKKKSIENDLEMKSLKEEMERKNQELKKSRESELELLNKEKVLKEKLESADLEVARRINEEADKIREETAKKVQEDNRLKDAEKDKKITDMLRQIEELKIKAQQGSQQLQGEVLELELEDILKREFPIDEITEVGKGIRGADIVHKVFDKNGRHSGTIIWESKRTKNWEKKWIEDLKVNMLASKGDVAVLVSVILPEGIKNFGFKDGIYITSSECFLSVAFLLRKSIIDHHAVKQSVVGKNEKMEMVYNYFLSPEFQQRVSAIAEAFTAMKNDLDTEKRVFTKLWAKREKEIEKVILNTSSLHGELHGLIGESLPKVKSLEADSLLLDIEKL